MAQRFADIQRLAGILIQGKPVWIVTAVCLEIVYYVVLATLFQSAFALLDIRTRLQHLIPIAFAFLFVNTTAASGGTAGLALFVDDIRRRGESVARAAAGTLLAHASNYAMLAMLVGLGMYLLFLAHGLWLHKRMAWLLTLIVLLPSVVSHLLQEDYVAASLGILLGIYLISQRTHFLALSDPPSVWTGTRVLLAALGFTLAYGVIGFYVLDLFEKRPFSLPQSWRQTLLLFTTLTAPNFQLETAVDFFTASIYIVGLCTLTYALFMLLRPVLNSAPATERERRQAQTIVKAYGRSALATVGTLPGKAYYFSPGGSVISYTRYRRTAIALGDPIGPDSDLVEAIVGFKAHCQHHDWQAVFYRTQPETLASYKKASLSVLRIGQEAVLNLANFMPLALETNSWQTAVYDPPHGETLLEQLRLISDEWLAHTGRREQPFIPDWFDKSYLQVGPLVVVTQEMGRSVAFASVVAAPNQEEAMLGLLRYSHEADETALLCLLTTVAVWAKENDFARLNLGLSQIKPEQTTESSTMERLLRLMRLHSNGHIAADDLYLLKTKLHPEWQPRYLIIPNPISLPSISVALNRTTGTIAPIVPE